MRPDFIGKVTYVSLLLLHSFFSRDIRAETISIRADNWCPFNCDPSDQERLGFLVEIVNEVFLAKGYKIDYKLENWARAKDGLKKGSWDAIVGAYKSDGADFIYPERLGYAQDCFWKARNSKVKWTYDSTYDSLLKTKVGAVQGYSYGERLDGFLKKAPKNVVEFVAGDDPLQLNLAKLDRGRIDVFVENLQVIRWMKLDSSKIEVAGCELPQEVFVAFSPAKNRPNSAKYAEMLSVGFNELKAKGKIAEIYKKYGLNEEGL